MKRQKTHKRSLFSSLERKYNLSNQQATIKTLNEKTKKTHKNPSFPCGDASHYFVL